MNSDVVVIEKWINSNDRLNMHYSKCVHEATIKLLRKGNPNLKWKMESTYKANIPYDLFKEIALKFIFVEYPDTEEIIDFVETRMKEYDEVKNETKKS